MAIWSVLLRVLLSIGLILNGSGSAMASMHMPMDAGHMQHQAAVPLQQMQPPCHDGTGAATDAVPPPATDALVNRAVDTSNAGSPKPHTPDCCESGACRCMCSHQCAAAIATLLLRDSLIVHATGRWPAQASHAAPALPHLIRPPIG